MFVYARRTGLIIQYATRAGSSGKSHHEARLFSLRQEAKKQSALESFMTIDIFPLILTEIRQEGNDRFISLNHFPLHCSLFSLATCSNTQLSNLLR